MEEKNKLEIEIEKTTSENIGEYKALLEKFADRYIQVEDSINLYKQTLKDIRAEAESKGIGSMTLELYVKSRRIKKLNTFQYELLADKMKEEI